MRSFEDRLRDAHDEDSNFAFSYNVEETDELNDEQYNSLLRTKYWEKTHSYQLQQEKERDRSRLEREVKEKKESELRKIKERKAIERLEAKGRESNRRERRDTRERYTQQWSRLLATPTVTKSIGPQLSDSTVTFSALRYSDFIWPLYPPMPFPPLSWPATEDITAKSIERFILDFDDDKSSKTSSSSSSKASTSKHTSSHTPSIETRKSLIRKQVLQYHPDRFDRLTARIMDETTRERVRELGLRVSEVLNELLKETNREATREEDKLDRDESSSSRR